MTQHRDTAGGKTIYGKVFKAGELAVKQRGF